MALIWRDKKYNRDLPICRDEHESNGVNQSTGCWRAWNLGTVDKDTLPYRRTWSGERKETGTAHASTGPWVSAREGSRSLCCSMKERMGSTR